MANYNSNQMSRSFLAEVDLDNYQWRFVKSSSVTSGYITRCSASSASVLGVLLNDPKAGEEATVLQFGYTKMKANTEGGASPLTMHGFVKAGSDGMAMGSANMSASTFSPGISYTTLATGSGVFVEVFVNIPGYRA